MALTATGSWSSRAVSIRAPAGVRASLFALMPWVQTLLPRYARGHGPAAAIVLVIGPERRGVAGERRSSEDRHRVVGRRAGDDGGRDRDRRGNVQSPESVERPEPVVVLEPQQV